MLKEIFSKNRDIIVNTDIDGFLCGLFLQKYFDCRIVGFSNSKKEIWIIPEIPSIYDPVYIDLYVVNPRVVCIEQHIIAKDDAHLNKIKALGTKINPNLDRNRTFEGDYYHKYPFGTIHYLLAQMEKEGINVALPDLQKIVSYPHDGNSTTLGHIIMRADDALHSTLSAYRDNAIDWWEFLDGGNNLVSVLDFVNFIDKCDRSQTDAYKRNIGNFFKTAGCKGADGAFDSITDSDGNLKPEVFNFYHFLKEAFEMPSHLSIPQKFEIHTGTFERCFLRKNDSASDSILCDPNLYSYAYIYGPYSKYPNFSFTRYMK